MKASNRETYLLFAAAALLLPAVPAGAQPCFEAEGADAPCCYFTPDEAAAACTDPEPCFGTEGPCFAVRATWWDPAVQAGLGAEKGIHLRWAFNLVPSPASGPDHLYGLTFPRGGFEIQRQVRQSTIGYQTIAPRVYPATDLATAMARIPSSVQTSDPEAYGAYTGDQDCDGRADLLDLIHLLRRATCRRESYADFWWVEESREVDGTPRYWPDPLVPEGVDLGPFIDYEQDFFERKGRYPLTYKFKPMELLYLVSADSVIARILGLYFVDLTAVEGTRYDYRVIAHHVFPAPRNSLRYCAEATDVGSLSVTGLRSPGDPLPVTASLKGLVQEQASDLAGSEMVVELSWTNYLRDVLGLPGPDTRLGPAAGITPIRYLIQRDDTGDPLGFQWLVRFGKVCDETVPVRAAPVLIGGKPNPAGAAAPPLWKDPPYFRDNSVVPGHKYKYRVSGVDIFGRYSPPAESGAITVVDRVPPPAPIVTEAAVFQTADPAVQRLAGEDPVKMAILGARSAIVLRMRWLWPESFRGPVPDRDDLQEFRVVAGDLARVVGTVPESAAVRVEEFPDTLPNSVTEDSPSACADGKDNDEDGFIDLSDHGCAGAADVNEYEPACSDALDNDHDGLIDLADDGCAGAMDVNEDNARAEVFEVYIGLDPFGLVTEPVSELDPVHGMIRFLEVGVRAFDTAGNGSTLQRLWKAAVRDLTPPAPPASPAKVPEPGPPNPEAGPPDPEGRSAVALEWAAEANLAYLVYRVDERRLCESLGLAPDDCPGASDGDLQNHAAGHFELFQRATSAPVGPFEPSRGGLRLGSLADRVPGLEAARHFYALRALDPAGNISPPSPASPAIRVRDGAAPAKPVIARAFGRASGEIQIEWLVNPEVDVRFYRLYRAGLPEHRFSKRKMVLVWTEDPEDLATTAFNGRTGRFEVIDAPPEVELIQYYRLEAEDTSGNFSALSEAAAARSVDRSPPDPPAWLEGTPSWACLDGAPQVLALWTTPRNASEFRLLRRQALEAGGWGAWQDLTGWLGRGHNFHEDRLASPESRYQFRVEARDDSGNFASSAVAEVAPAPDICRLVRFVRGDSNADGGRPDITDAINLLTVLFIGRGEIPCREAANLNGDLEVDIADAIYLLYFLFIGGDPPPPPFPECGGPAVLLLGCDSFPPCGLR